MFTRKFPNIHVLTVKSIENFEFSESRIILGFVPNKMASFVGKVALITGEYDLGSRFEIRTLKFDERSSMESAG